MPAENYAPVALRACREYDRSTIASTLARMADDLGMEPDRFAGKRIVIKPNLVSAMKPEEAATTHPVFLCAVVDLLRAHGAENITIAESPGGVYSEAILKHAYRVTGIAGAAEACGVALNTDTGAGIVHYRDGKVCHAFDILDPIRSADVIVDLCKLKSHSLTELSCAVKNFFGCVPGVEKFEMHSAYPTKSVFSEMITDLCAMMTETHEVLAVCDGILAMEGNGPTGGNPREVGAILMSTSPFCLDTVAAHLIGVEGKVPILDACVKRSKCPERFTALDIRGDDPDALAVRDFRKPDTDSFLNRLPDIMGGRLADFFSPKPVIDPARCVGCGVCARSCPQHTIVMREKKGRRYAAIERKQCIRCFCCQELCPSHVVRIRQNPFISILTGK